MLKTMTNEDVAQERFGPDGRIVPMILPEGPEAGRLRASRRLDAILRKGPPAVTWSDIPGFEWARLREVRFDWAGLGNEIEARWSDDLLLSFRTRGRWFPTRAPLVRAIFEVKIAGTDSRIISMQPYKSLSPARRRSVETTQNSFWPSGGSLGRTMARRQASRDQGVRRDRGRTWGGVIGRRSAPETPRKTRESTAGKCDSLPLGAL